MCLGVPGVIESIEGKQARVNLEGITCDVGTHLVEDVKVGDFVLVHSGFILEKLDPEEARETLEIFEQLRKNWNKE